MAQIADKALSKISGKQKYELVSAGASILIGGKKEADDVFVPEVHAEKWAGMAWLTIRHKDADKVKKEKPKAISKTTEKGLRNGVEVKIDGKTHRIFEGSIEWDIVYDTIDDIPADWIERFELEYPLDQLRFYKQLPLTQSEIDEGCERPDNVINSFAIYYPKSGCFLDKNGDVLEDYQTGKFGHLYRSKLIDANGDWIWIDQDIDGSELQARLDQEWLSTAVFPVTLDPTFGYETAGSSLRAMGVIAYANGHPDDIYTASTGDTITKYTLRCRGYEDGQTIYISAYEWDSGNDKPTNRVASPVGITPINGTTEWIDTSAVSHALTGSTDYVLACGDAVYVSTNPRYYYDSVSDVCERSNDLSDPWVTSSTDLSDRISIYATYTAGGGTTTGIHNPLSRIFLGPLGGPL